MSEIDEQYWPGKVWGVPKSEEEALIRKWLDNHLYRFDVMDIDKLALLLQQEKAQAALDEQVALLERLKVSLTLGSDLDGHSLYIVVEGIDAELAAIKAQREGGK